MVHTEGTLSVPGPGPSLEEQYARYRTRQAELLPTLVPREALRPLIREAQQWAADRGLETGKDPLALLRAFCEEILPLPPIGVWSRVYGASGAFREPLEDGSHDPRSADTAPILLDLRDVVLNGEPWVAGLTVRQVEHGWRGFIAFTAPTGQAARTAEVFREDSLPEVRERFASLESPTLAAFLRSALP